MGNYMQQRNFDNGDGENPSPIPDEGENPPIITPPILEEDEHTPPIFEQDEHSSKEVPWHKNPVIWIAIVSLLIAIIALGIYMRQRKFDF